MQINDDKPYDDINITPMLDLAYVLLVIFILMTTASVQGMKVKLGLTTNPQGLAQPKMKAITITTEGRVSLDAVPVSMQELEQKLQTWRASHPEAPVVVRGDTATAYQPVMDVFDVLGRLGITQVGLATKSR
jgi:biopolymer transport protein ExbD